MKLSELISAYGDERVKFQNLDGSISNMQSGKQANSITFKTDQPFGFDGTAQLGLVVWMDRDRVKEIMAAAAKGEKA